MRWGASRQWGARRARCPGHRLAVGTPLCDDSGCLGGDPAACIRGDREGVSCWIGVFPRLLRWLALVTESYVFAACAREVAWLRLVVDEAALTSSDIGEFVERQRRVDPVMSTLTVKSGQKVRSEIDAKVAEVQGFIDSVLQPLAQRRTRLDLDDGVRINRLKLAYGWRSDLADLPQPAIGAATPEVKRGIASDLKWARGEIKKNNVWWS